MVVEFLEAVNVELDTLVFGDAFAGVVDLGLPFFNGFLSAVISHLHRLAGVGELFAALAAEVFDEFFALRDGLIELDDLGVFGAEIFAEAGAQDDDFFQFLLGAKELGGAGWRKGDWGWRVGGGRGRRRGCW